jgi:hypothetical protein
MSGLANDGLGAIGGLTSDHPDVMIRGLQLLRAGLD